jgi:hypothetical protein
MKIIRNAYNNWLYGPRTGPWVETQQSTLQGRMIQDVLVVFTRSQIYLGFNSQVQPGEY